MTDTALKNERLEEFKTIGKNNLTVGACAAITACVLWAITFGTLTPSVQAHPLWPALCAFFAGICTFAAFKMVLEYAICDIVVQTTKNSNS